MSSDRERHLRKEIEGAKYDCRKREREGGLVLSRDTPVYLLMANSKIESCDRAGVCSFPIFLSVFLSFTSSGDVAFVSVFCLSVCLYQ
mmetsp:Transcript_31217/g.61616  ORF Transcript_31217/g.61616 Transcript_31217/m.61616 type:complete len:88 (-) Transcript_31217:1969-2232(-)